jgi:hypothetical protein
MPTNPLETYVPLNGAGGALAQIVLKTMARFVEICEDEAPASPNGGVAQGLQGNLVDPVTGALTPPVANAGYWKRIDPEAVPAPAIKLGDPRSVHGGMGVPVGGKGAVIAQLTSATNTPTQVIVREWY